MGKSRPRATIACYAGTDLGGKLRAARRARRLVLARFGLFRTKVTVSATQAGRSEPSTSMVTLVTKRIAFLPMTLIDSTERPARMREPTRMGWKKRTLFRP